MKKIISIMLLIAVWSVQADSTLRMTKSEKTQLVEMVAEPMKKIEQKIDSINQVASQIQNYIIDNFNQPVDQSIKEQLQVISNKISHLALLVEALAYVMQAQVQITQDLANQLTDLQNEIAALELQIAQINAVLGSLADVSVGEEEFNSVQDIDDAQLSVISWLKTIYREQLYNKFIS